VDFVLTNPVQQVVPRDELRQSMADDVSGWRKELDSNYLRMADFGSLDSREIFVMLAAFTSRASYLRSRIYRTENRVLNAFRTRELDPFIEECDRQFKIWSRVVSVDQSEWDKVKGF
jgi:CRISPR/Cas system-associated endonuclease Cas3-HD